MPPGKRKDPEEATSASDILKDYLRTQNRPFNSKMLYENLHGAVGKKDVDTLLETFAKNGTVVQKDYGKQTVFWYNQALHETLDAAAVQALDLEIAALAEQLQQEQLRLDKHQARCAELAAVASNEQVDSQLASLEKTAAQQETELAGLRATKKRVARADYEAVQTRVRHAIGEWDKRRRLARGMIDMISDQTSMSKADLADEIGLDDEPHGNVYDSIRVAWT